MTFPTSGRGADGEGVPSDRADVDQRAHARSVARADPTWKIETWTWDFHLGATWRVLGDGPAMGGRLRTGVLRIDEPWALAVGALGALDGRKPFPSVGAEVELQYLPGALFASVGGTAGLCGGAGLHLGAGIQLVAFEFRWRPSASVQGRAFAGLLRLRVPISRIVRYADTRVPPSAGGP